jgi:hypothetical protein
VVIRAGDSDRGKRDRQPSLLGCALLVVCEISAASFERGNKKSAISRMLREHGPTAPSVDNSKVRSQVTATDRTCFISRTNMSILSAYTSLWTLSTYFSHSTEFSGAVCYCLSKASGGKNLEVEQPVACWDCTSFDFHPTLPGMLSPTLIRDQVVQQRQAI